MVVHLPLLLAGSAGRRYGRALQPAGAGTGAGPGCNSGRRRPMVRRNAAVLRLWPAPPTEQALCAQITCQSGRSSADELLAPPARRPMADPTPLG